MGMEEHTATIMVIHRMNKNNEILTLVQLFSSSFPVGSFAYSHGMESAINDGLITNANDFRTQVYARDHTLRSGRQHHRIGGKAN